MTCAGCQDCPFVNGGGAVGHHEIHITVETARVGRFIAACEEVGINPIVIEFQTNLQDTDTHVMTSYQMKGTDDEAGIKADEISEYLRDCGFKVIRTKIETTIRGDRDYTKGYFESHLAFRLQTHQQQALGRILNKASPTARLSRNAFKKDGDSIVLMATVRHRDCTPAAFKAEMERVVKYMADYCFPSERLIIEYCWYDSAESVDNGWV